MNEYFTYGLPNYYRMIIIIAICTYTRIVSSLFSMRAVRPSTATDHRPEVGVRPRTAAHGARAGTSVACFLPARSVTIAKLSEDLNREAGAWCSHFSKASTAVEALCAAMDGQASGVGQHGRRQSELLDALKLVADRLGTAITQVQHTRAQAAALAQFEEKLGLSDRERQRLQAAADATHIVERRAHNELQMMRVELCAEEHARRRAPAATPSGELDALRRELQEAKREVTRLRAVADKEMCQRFEATKDLEAANRELARLASTQAMQDQREKEWRRQQKQERQHREQKHERRPPEPDVPAPAPPFDLSSASAAQRPSTSPRMSSRPGLAPTHAALQALASTHDQAPAAPLATTAALRQLQVGPPPGGWDTHAASCSSSDGDDESEARRRGARETAALVPNLGALVQNGSGGTQQRAMASRAAMRSMRAQSAAPGARSVSADFGERRSSSLQLASLVPSEGTPIRNASTPIWNASGDCGITFAPQASSSAVAATRPPGRPPSAAKALAACAGSATQLASAHGTGQASSLAPVPAPTLATADAAVAGPPAHVPYKAPARPYGYEPSMLRTAASASRRPVTAAPSGARPSASEERAAGGSGAVLTGGGGSRPASRVCAGRPATRANGGTGSRPGMAPSRMAALEAALAQVEAATDASRPMDATPMLSAHIAAHESGSMPGSMPGGMPGGMTLLRSRAADGMPLSSLLRPSTVNPKLRGKPRPALYSQ